MGYSRSTVTMITGTRGSGKSLLMAFFAIDELMRGKTVWSNMQVKMTERMAKGYGLPQLESLPLDLNALYTLSGDLQDGVVCIDEAQNLSDSRSSLTLKNRILNAIIAQVRKRSLNVYFTVQDASWVDIRLRFSTDVEIECFDLGYSPWGRHRKVDWGKYIRCYFKDLSGYMTGTSFFKTGKYYRKKIFKGQKYWDCYDTRQTQDVEEIYTPVRMDMKERIISNKESASGMLDNTVLKALFHFRNKGYKEIPSSELWEYLETEEGLAYSPGLGKYIPDFVKRKQKADGTRVYDLSRITTTTSD